jgi:cation:H+ antiporter
LILGAAALIRPVRVDGAVRRRELPALLVSTAVLPLLIVDGRVERWEAAALAMGAIGYTLWALRSARTAADVREAQRRAMVTAKAAETGGAPPARARTRAVTAVLVGFGALVVGGHLIVAAATSLARAWGVSDRVIALTIVAWGTSLPELATSVIAAVRGHSEIALGNVIGSNIFNVMFCLASAGALVPIAVSPAPLLVDIAALLCLTVITAVFIRSERTIRRWEAALLLIGYAGFVGYLALARPV